MTQLEAVEGLDSSGWNGEINWRRLRRENRGITFNMIRLGEWRPDGDEAVKDSYGLADEQAERAIYECRRAAITPGGYLRSNPALNSAEKEAVEFVTRMYGFGLMAPGNMVPCLDIEDTTQQWGPWLREFITVYRAISNVWKLRLYSSGSFFASHYGGVDDMLDIGGIQLLVADWSATPGSPKFNPPIATVHQYSNGSTPPAIAYTTANTPVKLDRQRVISGRRFRDVMI